MSTRPVLLIHGMGSSFEHGWATPGWEALLQELGRSVIGIELPGHGHSKVPTDARTASLIEETARPHGTVDAVGFSAGANALLVAASHSPELFEKIAVLGVGDSSLAESRAAAGDWREQFAAGLEADEPEPGAAGSGEDADDVGSADMPAMIRRVIRSAGNDPAAVAAYARSEQPSASRSDLPNITADCLVVEGGADVVGSAQHLTELIPNARRIVLKGVDHYAIPNDFGCLDAVLAFLDS